MELSQLAEALGISRRKINYVLEHDIIPLMNSVHSGRGVPRNLDGPQALAVAIACVLSDDGLHQKLVRQVLKNIAPEKRREGFDLDVRALWSTPHKYLLVYGGQSFGLEGGTPYQLETGRRLQAVPLHMTELRIDLELLKQGINKAGSGT